VEIDVRLLNSYPHHNNVPTDRWGVGLCDAGILRKSAMVLEEDGESRMPSPFNHCYHAIMDIGLGGEFAEVGFDNGIKGVVQHIDSG
jgi:hypothetical protein